MRLGQHKGCATAASPSNAQSTLENELRRRTEELATAERYKDELLLALSHELRNPLQAISMGLALLETRRSDARQGPEVRATMRRQLDHLAGLVEALLDAARLAHGLARVDHEPIDLRRIVVEAAETYAPLLRARGRRLVLHVGSAPMRIRGDARRMSQVLGNLLSNALKYTKRGGHVRVTLERAPLDGGGFEAVLRVKDDGVGIPTEQLQAVFRRFVQLDMGAARTSGGLGMGLPIVRDIILAHGGEVEAKSLGRGSGTEIIVRKLALVRPPEATTGVRRHRIPTKQRASTRRILVIEDNDDARDGLVALLGLWGHEVYGACDGEEGLTLIEQHRPDVALVDLGLPRVDGYEVARRVRAMAGGQRVRLIAVTGYGGPKERERARQAGFEAHFVKPVDTDRLARALVERRGPVAPALMG